MPPADADRETFTPHRLWFVSRQDAKGRDETQIEFPLDGIQGLILTHVHLDHIGRVPYLINAGYNGPIYCTPPTAKLLPLMLEDALRLGVTRNKRLIARFLQELKRLVRPMAYGKWHKLDGGTEFRFLQAGHVLGRLMWKLSTATSALCLAVTWVPGTHR